MKRRIILSLFITGLMATIVACNNSEGDGLTEDQRVETRAAEIIQATTDFELAVEK